jgi:hypothetical protein
MLETEPNLDQILNNNPNVTRESIQRVDLLLKRLELLGIQDTGYRLETPFSLLKKTPKQKKSS